MVGKEQHEYGEDHRGVTSFFIGSVPRARIASICSVTTIEPSSLAIPAQVCRNKNASTAPASAIHARLVEVKNVSAEVSERQALSNLIRRSRSREPAMKYGSLSPLMLRVDVGASLAGLEHRRDVAFLPAISCWERSENRLKRLLSCVGMSKLLEWFLLFLATMASSHAEDCRLAKDGGEVRI